MKIIKCTMSEPGKLCGHMKVKTTEYEGERCGLQIGLCALQEIEKPKLSRIDIIGQNGNDGEHYE